MPNKELELRELLMSTSHEKLADILLSLHAQNTDIQRQLDIVFASLDENPKKIISMIKKEITSLKRSSRFVNYYESRSLSDRLDELRLNITNRLSDKSPQIAFEIMLDFLDLHVNTLERVDDSSGVVGEVFSAACEDLGSLAAASQLDNQEIVEIVFTRFMNNGYGIYDNIIHEFKCSLTDQCFDLLKIKFENVSDSKNDSVIKLGLKSIADCRNDVDQYISACSFKNDICDHDHLDIAKRLIKHWRPKEALQWLETMEIPTNHFWEKDRKLLKIEALELDGSYAQAQEERLSWFSNTLSSEIYTEILNKSKSDFKESFRLEAIKKSFDFKDPHTALNFLVQIHELEEVAKFVRVRFEELNGDLYYILRPAANLIKDIDPVAATLLYRKMIDPILSEAKYKYYNYAVKDLLMCSVLSSKITDYEQFQSHDDYFKEVEVKNKRKVRFWLDYQSALEKQAAKEMRARG